MSDRTVYRWLHRPGQELSLLSGEQTVLRYHFQTDREKPYFHPLCTTDGIPLTAFEPWDHVWHRGVWFAWVYIDGLDYWEEFTDGRRAGRTELVPPEEVRLGPQSATVAIRLRYRPPDGGAVLEEQREIVIGLPRPDGSYTLDWRQTFAALTKEVVLDRRAITPEIPWGGYGGLSWRAARTLGNFRAVDSEGRKDKEIEHQRARWVDLSGVSDGGRNLAGGVAMFDHPANPRFPTYWRCMPDPGFGYFGPSFLLAGLWTVAPRQPLTLRYRVLVHDGWADAAALEQEHQRFYRAS